MWQIVFIIIFSTHFGDNVAFRNKSQADVHFVGQPQNSLVTCYAIQFSFTRCKSILSRGNQKYFVVNSLRSTPNDSYFIGYDFQCISKENISPQIPDNAFGMIIITAKVPLMPLALLSASLRGQLMLVTVKLMTENKTIFLHCRACDSLLWIGWRQQKWLTRIGKILPHFGWLAGNSFTMFFDSSTC